MKFSIQLFLILAATKALIDGHAKSQNAMMVRMTELYSGAGIPLPGKM